MNSAECHLPSILREINYASMMFQEMVSYASRHKLDIDGIASLLR